MANHYAVTACAVILFQCFALGKSVASPNENGLLTNSKFTHEGHIFYNASLTGSADEKYLLNQDVTNIKLSSQLQLNEWSKIYGLLIYTTVPTPLTPTLYFEQLYADFKIPQIKYNMRLGKLWVPFGNYKNDLIYKPFSKALGQTNEYAVVVGYDNVYYANLSLFAPHTHIRNSSLPVHYNINLGLHNDNFDTGISYIYSIADSQLFQYNKGFGGFLSQTIESHVPGVATYLNFNYKQFNTNFTFVSALHGFNLNELSYQNKPAIPKVFSVQSGYQFDIKNIPIKIIGFYDQSFQALALKLPEKRTGVGLNIYPTKLLDVQFQCYKDHGYDQHVSATGLDKAFKGNSKVSNTLALQLVLNF